MVWPVGVRRTLVTTIRLQVYGTPRINSSTWVRRWICECVAYIVICNTYNIILLLYTRISMTVPCLLLLDAEADDGSGYNNIYTYNILYYIVIIEGGGNNIICNSSIDYYYYASAVRWRIIRV